jgi:alkaline phosphatase
MTTDFIAWDDSVKVAIEFADKDGDTVVLAQPDHNTGGLKVGNFKHEYVDRTVEFAREPLLKMKMTSEGVVKMMGVAPENATASDLKASVSANWGLNITDKEAEDILAYSAAYSSKFLSNPADVIPLNYALARLISDEHTIAGWTTHGHNAEDGAFPPFHGIRSCKRHTFLTFRFFASDESALLGARNGTSQRSDSKY